MPTASAPTPRLKHSATWTGSELIVWGGTTGNVDIPGGARWNEASDTWTALATTNEPSPRHGHSATWTGSQLVIWGGTSGSSTTMQDGARVAPDGDTWTALPTAGAPTARSGHVAVWTGDQILIWGGAAASPVSGRATQQMLSRFAGCWRRAWVAVERRQSTAQAPMRPSPVAK